MNNSTRIAVSVLIGSGIGLIWGLVTNPGTALLDVLFGAVVGVAVSFVPSR